MVHLQQAASQLLSNLPLPLFHHYQHPWAVDLQLPAALLLLMGQGVHPGSTGP
jgi:hypothetical protein